MPIIIVNIIFSIIIRSPNIKYNRNKFIKIISPNMNVPLNQYNSGPFLQFRSQNNQKLHLKPRPNAYSPSACIKSKVSPLKNEIEHFKTLQFKK